jgi:chromosome segregation ATPase
MSISQEQLDQLERRLQQTIDEKVNNLRTELIQEARSIVESYQRSDRTAARLQDALDKIKTEVLRTVRSSVSSQIAAIRAQQERDLSQLTTTVTSTISERLRAFKAEVAEYTSSDRGSNRDSQVVSLEHQIKLSLQQLDATNTSFQQQLSSVLAMIRKEKSEAAGRVSETAISQAQVDEEERKIRLLQAEIAAREKQLAEEKSFLQQQTEEFMKEKRQAERARAAGRRYGQDHELERSMLKELEGIRRSLGSSVTTEVSSVVRELREEVAQIGRERERLRSAREMMQRTLMAGGDLSYAGFGVPIGQASMMRHPPFIPE